MTKIIEDLAGKTIGSIRPLYSGDYPYMIEVIFTDTTVLKIDIAHHSERYLDWKIES